ncbi:MAG: ribbon-helix-helix protein, CopG family [Alphaproteobacteria bacterium]|nr:MAG: ribbon-helix-helix protein, CopG family [Alphaproteobacteria bacterium]TMK07736.1 MAG: ribbon-helix-helix protein, CopG family [Alphaproteobacteria bacterium]
MPPRFSTTMPALPRISTPRCASRTPAPPDYASSYEITMPDDVVIDARIPAELDEALSRLASARRKSKSALVREALAEFVLSEEAFAAAVEEGLADARAGRLVDHDEVMREIRQLLHKKR